VNIKKQFILLLLLNSIVITSCNKKDKEREQAEADFKLLKKSVLSDISGNVIYATYNDLESKSQNLYNSLAAFNSSNSEADLTASRNAWKDVRLAWEQSEGFLFGPVSIDNIDPRVDTWPIDFARIDSVLNTSEVLTESYVNNLEEALKGFHPLEFILWGSNGNKAATNFTSREKEFMMALATNLKNLCSNVKNAWIPGTSNSYHTHLSNAGNGSIIYENERAAFEEIIDALIGICDEVANGKIAEPYNTQDASLEESPFAKNSITDFKNNMISVQNIYQGKYSNDGKGIEDLLKDKNLSMDLELKAKINASIQSLENITVPFGEAIITQRTQVQKSIDAINDLKSYLEVKVKPYLQSIMN
jgi:putative iron-regulated protein